MIEFKCLDCCGIQDVVVNSEPNHVFEYEKSAWDLAEKVSGSVVRLFYTPYFHLRDVSYDDCECIGYGVVDNNDKLI